MTKCQFIPKPDNGRRFAITDVHGCAKTFKTLVQDKIKLEKEDQLFLLGDYINRGPDSKGVIDFILELQKENFQVLALRGNHEQSLTGQGKMYINGIPKIIKSQFRDGEGNVISPYIEFVESLPYYFVLDKFYLVHAGFNFKSDNFLEDYKKMLWIKRFQPKLELLEGRKIIHGHIRKSISDIKKTINQNEIVISLDNGVYKTDIEGFGSLCALNLDTFELLTQKNIE